MAAHPLRFGEVLLILICSACAEDYTGYDRDVNKDELKHLLNVQNEHIKILEETINSLVGTVKALADKDKLLEKTLKEHELNTGGIESKLKTFCKEEDDLIKQSINKLTSTHGHLPSINRRQQGSSAIAFSSYLDHDVNSLGASQAIVFNKVQLNDGNGYSQHTGAFTVPVSGVYVFTFFIGERDFNQLYIKLVVNGVEKSDAVVETIQSAHDAQGGNVVILKVSKDDIVMVQHGLHGSHIEGSPANRLSTFSGFLLYELDTEVIVGK